MPHRHKKRGLHEAAAAAAAAAHTEKSEMLHRHKKRRLEKKAAAAHAGESEILHQHKKERPVYLVVGHEEGPSTYSVFKVDPYADGGGGDDGKDSGPARLPRRLTRLRAKFGMSFVPVRSRHGAWIVGVGSHSNKDCRPETIVFDTETHAVIRGPKLLSTKLQPVVLPFGDRIYSLASFPAFKGELNFVPWFEVLDLSQARVVDGRLENCEWKALPRPPFFPWELTPRQYLFPPKVIVQSYVAVGSYILVSVTDQPGTHMFDIEKEQWSKLAIFDLPFIGPAVPHGPLFLGMSKATQAITAYKIRVCPPSASINACLRIAKFPVVSGMGEEIARSFTLTSLGSSGFCAGRSFSDDPTWDRPHTRAIIKLWSYQTDECLSKEYVKSHDNLLISNQWKQVYKIRDPYRELTWPCLVAAISM